MSKLQTAIQAWPKGTIATANWLASLGISRQLCQKYLSSGWIKSIGYGAFVKSEDTPGWLGGVHALQQELPIHVGGITSLELLGRAHFIPLGEGGQLYLYNHGGQSEIHIPKWYQQFFTNKVIQKYNLRLFKTEVGLQTYATDNFSVQISGIERALFEILVGVPKKIRFEYAAQLFEGQNTLRPELVQALLEECRIERVKRLFLYLAREQQLACFEHLNLKKVKLSANKITIGDGSLYVPDLRLYVPQYVFDEEVGV